MTELVFLRHGPRADRPNNNAEPLHSPYKVYDSSVTRESVEIAAKVADHILELAQVEGLSKKNIYIHFSPYLRCCETADLLVTQLQTKIGEKHAGVVAKFQLLGDFALSEWIHDKMKNKPPFFDSNEAYQMYTPNIHMMQNRKYVSNFRPTTKLGPWNEPDLSFKEFQERCKNYFQKLLATYDKPAHDNDMIIVVSHGYVISNFISHFISQPIFEEIPEFSVNFAKKSSDSWVLQHDCLGFLQRDPDLDSTLNLDSDIVYYKTNFIKKHELDESKEFPALGFGGLRGQDGQPRPSFRIKSLSTNSSQTGATQTGATHTRNPLCPAAKNWDPQRSASFQVKSEFRMKVMNDEAFKKAFDITKAPKQPMSPEVSPNSEPSRINSTVDLAKLMSNEEIYKPLKLKYSSASDIPVHHLNSKVNSHVSLNQFHPHGSTNSSLDLARMPMNILPGNVSGGSASPRDIASDLESSPNMNEVISRLSRVRSLQRKRPQTATPKFGIISEQDTPPATNTENKFALQFGNAIAKSAQGSPDRSRESTPGPITRTKSNEHGPVRFVPSMLSYQSKPEGKTEGKPETKADSKPEKKENKAVFYHFNSGSNTSDESSDEEHGEEKYMWFGQNVKSK
ncbi:hypothetical protein JCM33374_g5234 [Metschnikowia sp. JCM 33374]|nr:hypothetical protein JCM33374_g5234 [Metschnikowia sp. JCM 33374]